MSNIFNSLFVYKSSKCKKYKFIFILSPVKFNIWIVLGLIGENDAAITNEYALVFTNCGKKKRKQSVQRHIPGEFELLQIHFQ